MSELKSHFTQLVMEDNGIDGVVLIRDESGQIVIAGEPKNGKIDLQEVSCYSSDFLKALSKTGDSFGSLKEGTFVYSEMIVAFGKIQDFSDMSFIFVSSTSKGGGLFNYHKRKFLNDEKMILLLKDLI